MARHNLRPVKPANPELLRLMVVRAARLSPSFVRVTLGGEDLDRFSPLGWDQWFRLFIPQDFPTEPRLPSSAGVLWWPQLLRMPASERPYVRNYTVAGFRGPERELDVDFVLHGVGERNVGETQDSSDDGISERADDALGVAARWAASAQPGWPVGLLDQGLGWNPPSQPGYILAVGDETSLPALCGIARSLPAEARGTIIVEVPEAGDRRALTPPAGVEVRWLVRENATDRHAAPGALALAAASAVEIPDDAVAAGTAYAWVTGEQALATGLRRSLVNRGMPKSHITFVGYWRA